MADASVIEGVIGDNVVDPPATGKLALYPKGVRWLQKTSAAAGSVETPIGSVWTSGSAVPDNGNGLDTDFYFRTGIVPEVYQKEAGAWVLKFQLTAYTDETAQDAFAALVAAGTHSGISISYNDATNAISFTNTNPGSPVQTSLNNHIANATGAHAASAISNTPAGNIAATTVQAALNELDTEKATTGSVTTVQTNLDNHINDTTDAHAASAITNTPAGGIAATTVQAAINELDTEKATVTALSNHTGAAAGAHAATAISNTPAGGISATTVQAAINELDTEKATTAALSAHTGAASGAHAASAISNTPAGNIAATDVQSALNELDSEKATTGSVTTVQNNLNSHTGAAAGAHAATAISFTPANGIAATTVQAAIEEAKTDSAISASTPDPTSNANALVLTGQQIQLGMATLAFPGIISAENYRKLTNSNVIDMQRDFDSYYCNDNYLGGGNDDTTPLQTALTQSGNAGGIPIILGSRRAGSLNRSRITAGLVIGKSGIALIGPGCAYTTDVGNYWESGGYWLVWRGAAGGQMLDLVPSNTGGSATPLLGVRLIGFNMDARNYQNGAEGNQAGGCIRTRAVSGATFSDLFLMDSTGPAIELGALTAGTIGGVDSHGTFRSRLERICIRQLDGAAKGPGIRFSGTATANANFNKLDTIQIMYDGANAGNPAIDFVNSDSNTLFNLTCNRGGSSQLNWGMVFRGSNASIAEVSRANQLFHCSPGANGAIHCGTSGGMKPDLSADASFNYTNPSTDNNWSPQSTENGEPIPYYAIGATGDFGYTGGSTGPAINGRNDTYDRKTTITAIANTETAAVGNSRQLPKFLLREKSTLRFRIRGLVTNTITASTSVIRIRIGPTSLTGAIVASWQVVMGTTARTNNIFEITADVSIISQGAAGSALGQIIVGGHFTTALAAPSTQLTAAVAINTLQNNFCECTIISGAASTVWTIHSATAELI